MTVSHSDFFLFSFYWSKANNLFMVI